MAIHEVVIYDWFPGSQVHSWRGCDIWMRREDDRFDDADMFVNGCADG